MKPKLGESAYSPARKGGDSATTPRRDRQVALTKPDQHHASYNPARQGGVAVASAPPRPTRILTAEVQGAR